jgi:hypothetical protein
MLKGYSEESFVHYTRSEAFTAVKVLMLLFRVYMPCDIAWHINTDQHVLYISCRKIRGCIQKFLHWSPGARTANGTALCQ